MSESKPEKWVRWPAERSANPFIVATEDGDSVADCSPSGPWISAEVAHRRANLVAAAPDLLAVAIAAQAYLAADGRNMPSLDAAIARGSDERGE